MEREMTIQNAKRAMLSGDAILTFVSKPTGCRYTFRLRRSKKSSSDVSQELKQPIFVQYLTGSNNETAYQYLGTIFNSSSFEFRLTAKSRLLESSVVVRAFRFVFNKVLSGIQDERIQIYHSGKCCRCGRLLTVPESIEYGIGPECIKISNKIVA